MRPSGIGFGVSGGAPEVLTNIFITNDVVYKERDNCFVLM
jgi:hypothetical protein